MLDSGRGLATLLALGVVVVAIVGYALGSHAGGGKSAARSHPAGSQLAAGNVLLEAPADWGPAPASPTIPGLALTGQLAFGPGADARKTGLVTGSIASAGATALPEAFVADLAAVPQTAVVTLSQVEAFRYTNVRVRGFDDSLTLFALPVPGGQTTVLGCYAPAGQPAALSDCEAVVATVRPVGQASSTSLTPNTTYASRLSELLGTLERRRVALRAEMAGAGSKRTAALDLADAFSTAAAGLARLESPIATDQAQIDLSRALLAARDAYRALAAAESTESFEAARDRVTAHESGVSHALENFTLLGYRAG